MSKNIFRLTVVALVLTFIVVTLGAYVRLSHAGLGCPDWPGCYGHLDVPLTDREITTANQNYPERAVEVDKAWKEMIHRYVAGILGLLILAITVMTWMSKRASGGDKALSLGLLFVVTFQAVLGMWTVTLLLKPLVVTAHLLGGMTVFSLLTLYALKQSHWRVPQNGDLFKLKSMVYALLAVVVVQIALGGWTSTNYAALACYGFPLCSGQLAPAVDFSDAFVLWRGLGIDYEGGVLDHPARVAIHLTHRLWAVIVFLMVIGTAIAVFKRSRLSIARNTALTLVALVIGQWILGIINVSAGLPLWAATAHNGGAALLLSATLFMLYLTYRSETPA